MNPSILATTQPRCACNCGQRITPTSPSPWWAEDGCYQRWLASHNGVAPQVDWAGIAEQAKKIAAGIKNRLK